MPKMLARTMRALFLCLPACCDICSPPDECSEYVVGRGIDIFYTSGTLTLAPPSPTDTAHPGDTGSSDSADTADKADTADTEAHDPDEVAIEVDIVRLDTGESSFAVLALVALPDGSYTLPGSTSPRAFVIAPSTECGDHEDYDAHLTFTLLLDGNPATDSHLQPIEADLLADDGISMELWGGYQVSCSMIASLYC